jgi:hypothetical protein
LLSLVSAIAASSHAIAVGVALVLLVLLRGTIRSDVGFQGKGRLSRLVIATVAVAASTLLVLGTAVSHPDHYDSGLYHAQSIRWIDEYPAIPGIANLHRRLAFNSSWHVLESFFGLSFLDPAGFRPLNGLLLVVTASAGLISMARLARGDVRPSRLMSAALFPLSMFYFQRHIASPLTDTPATLIVWLLWAAVLDHLERTDHPRIDRETATLVVIAFFLVTVKISAAPAILVALVALGRPWTWSPGPGVRLGAAAGVVLVPWLMRSVILSGTLAFPFAALDPLPVEWAISHDLAAHEEAVTRSWARIPGRIDVAEVLALPPSVWIPQWWSAAGQQIQAALTVLILGPIIWALLLPRSMDLVKSVIRAPRPYFALVLAGYVGLLFWFTSAPDVRFGLATLAPLLVMLLIPLVLVAHRLAPLAVQALLIIALLMPVRGPLEASLESVAQTERIMKPAGFYSSQTQVVVHNGFPVLAPTGTDQCWNAPLPCTPALEPGLILRGCTLDAGFRISTAPELERRTDCAPMSSVQGRSRVPEILPAPQIERVVVQRRNQVMGPDLDCDAERQNHIRVLVRNRGAPAPEAVLTFELDDAVVAHQPIGALGTNEERWIDAGVTPRPRRGDHVLILRVTGLGEHSDNEQRLDVRCS